MKNLIFYEFNIQRKIYNIPQYSCMFFLICCFSFTFINNYKNMQIFGVIFIIITIPLAFISLSHHLIKPDIEDGTIESLLTLFKAEKIIIAKYIALCSNCCFSVFCTAPLIFIMYDIKLSIFISMILSSIIILLLSAALIILMSSIQGYFRSNTNFLSILIMPLLIPNIIVSGIFLQNSNDLYLLYIMIGVNLIVIPPSLYLSSYLVQNIYNT